MSSTELSAPASDTTGGSVLRGSTWSAAGTIVPQFLSLVLSVVAARFLGPDQMGRQSFIAFIALSISSIFGGGIGYMLMRFVGEGLGAGKEEATRGLVVWGYRVALVGALVGAGVMFAAALSGAEPTAAWILAGAGCALAILQAVPNAVLIGNQRWRQISTVGLVTGTLAVPLTIAVFAAGGGIAGFFAVQVATIGSNLIWSTLLARGVLLRLTPRVAHDPALQHRAASYAVGMTFSIALSMVVFKRSEFFFLAHYSSDAQIAVYSIAFAAVYVVTSLSESLANTMLPAFATLFGGGADKQMRTGFERGQRLLIMFSLPLMAAALALGPQILRIVYGSAYSASGQLLQIMALGIPLLALMGLANSFLAGLGKVKPVLAITGVGAAVNVGLAFVLIPPLDARGAAMANLASQIVVGAMTVVYADRLLGHAQVPLRTLGTNLAASLVGGAAAFFAVEAVGGPAGLLVGLVAGLAGFAATAAVIKVIRADDAHWLLASSAGTWLSKPAAFFCRAFAARPPAPANATD